MAVSVAPLSQYYIEGAYAGSCRYAAKREPRRADCRHDVAAPRHFLLGSAFTRRHTTPL